MSNDLAKPAIPMAQGMVQLTSIESAYRFAQCVLQSGLAPKSFNSAESILVAVQLGAELGMKPMQSLQNIAVINGRPSVYGKAIVGLVLPSGQLEEFKEWWEGEGETLVARCKVKRKGLGEKTADFSWADAKRAGLTQKDTYQKYPRDLLMSKARARAFILFSDILIGLPVYEDIQDVEPEKRAELAAPETSDPLLKQAVASVVETAKEETPSEKKEQTPAEFLRSMQSDPVIGKPTGKPERKKKSAPAETTTVEAAKPAAEVTTQPEPRETKKTYVCAACQDTGKNSRGAPCPICQKPDKASGDPFTATVADDSPTDETLMRLEDNCKDVASMPIEELRSRCNASWKIMTADDQKSVIAALHLKSAAEMKTFTEVQLRNFLSECVNTYKAGM